MAYIPASHFAGYYSDENIDVEHWQGVSHKPGNGLEQYWPNEQPRDYFSSLIAWDPVSQEQKWIVPLEISGHGGTLTTAGNLVFQGTLTGQLHAYNAETGETLWTYEAGLGITAPPITYQINERQYISVLVGAGGAVTGVGGNFARSLGWAYKAQTRRLITFSLHGKTEVSAQAPPSFPEPIAAPEFIVDEQLAQAGAIEYYSCLSCHGPNVVAGGMAPDLRSSAIPLDSAAFRRVVKKGMRTNMGMPAYPDNTDEQLEKLRHYIRQKANEI